MLENQMTEKTNTEFVKLILGFLEKNENDMICLLSMIQDAMTETSILCRGKISGKDDVSKIDDESAIKIPEFDKKW
jgi:hypothetical protein